MPAGPPARDRVIVAIPAKNEADHIGECVRAVALQQEAGADAILVLLNDTDDDSAAQLQALRPMLPVPLHVLERRLPAGQGCAGLARRMAMEAAAEQLGENGILLTTDADGRVAPDWLAANLHHLRHGADAVMGRALIDPVDAARIPDRLHADDALECAYAALLDQIDSLIDPDPADPWPRHDEHSGASIAVRCATYHLAGGMPAASIAEDRQFYESLRRIDARIRHAPDVQVTVSGRLHGRASGGMADTMRRRMDAPDDALDDRLEPVADWVRRRRLRVRLRIARQFPASEIAMLAQELALCPNYLTSLLAMPYFGACWAAVERASETLIRRRVRVAALAEQTALAIQMRDALLRAGPSHPDDTARSESLIDG